MLKNIMRRFETRPSARLLCIFVVVYSVPEKDFAKLLGLLKYNKDAVKRVRELTGNSTKVLKRVWPVMTDT